MNFIRQKVLQKITRGLFMASGAESPVAIAARSGFDWLLLDMEHGLGGEQETRRQIAVMRSTSCAPLVRIPALRNEYVKRLLDLGAAGIMCPMVETEDQARQLVRAMRYPPEGIRGLTGGSYAADLGFSFGEYFPAVNQNLLCVVQIETETALANVEKIAAVDGVDVLFIGHSDLSLNLGCYGDFACEKMICAENAVLSAARKAGKIPGMLLKSSMAAEDYLQKGFRFLALGTDHGCMKQSFKTVLKNAGA